MKRRKEWTHDNCPRCNEPDKDTMHVLTCNDPRAMVQRDESLAKLWEWMTKADTSPALQRAIIRRTKLWFSGETITAPWASGGVLRFWDAMEAQDGIGWDNFMHGRVSKKISEYQDRHYRSKESKQSGF